MGVEDYEVFKYIYFVDFNSCRICIFDVDCF